MVETVTPADMTVRLDAGRSVAFDLKDYAHLDHGYAATIHKAQGVTVDRVHVLATPGLDRHAAYVALSRHRESVQLHYGRDDFADDARLARVLSRERAKDMAGDYERELAPAPNRGPDRAGEARSASASPDRQDRRLRRRKVAWNGMENRTARRRTLRRHRACHNEQRGQSHPSPAARSLPASNPSCQPACRGQKRGWPRGAPTRRTKRQIRVTFGSGRPFNATRAP